MEQSASWECKRALVKNFPEYYGTRRLLPHLQEPANCPYLEPDEHSPFHCPTPWRCTFNNTILSTLGSSKWFPFPRSPHKDSVCASPLPFTCSMPHPSHSPWFYHPNTIWWGVQIIRLLVMQSSAVSSHRVPVRFNYSPQHPILEHPKPTFLSQYKRMVSHPYKITGSVIVLCILFLRNIFG